MGIEAGEHGQQGSPIPPGFTQADDAAAAEADAGAPHPGQGFEPLLVGAGADDLVVVLGAGVEVVVVGSKAGLGQALGLGVGEHAGGHAGLEPQLPHAPHHLEHGLEGGSVADFAPGPAHAEALGAGRFGGPGPFQHRCHLQVGAAFEVAAVVQGLGAVGAVLFTAAGFNAEQGGELHPVAGIGLAMHRLGAPEQVHQGQGQKGLDLGHTPVVAQPYPLVQAGTHLQAWLGAGWGEGLDQGLAQILGGWRCGREGQGPGVREWGSGRHRSGVGGSGSRAGPG